MDQDSMDEGPVFQGPPQPSSLPSQHRHFRYNQQLSLKIVIFHLLETVLVALSYVPKFDCEKFCKPKRRGLELKRNAESSVLLRQCHLLHVLWWRCSSLESRKCAPGPASCQGALFKMGLEWDHLGQNSPLSPNTEFHQLFRYNLLLSSILP